MAKSETLTITLRRPASSRGGRQLYMTHRDAMALMAMAGAPDVALGRKKGRTLNLQVEGVGAVVQGDTHAWWITHQSGPALEVLSRAFDALAPGGSFTVVVTAATYNDGDGGGGGGDAPSLADLLG